MVGGDLCKVGEEEIEKSSIGRSRKRDEDRLQAEEEELAEDGELIKLPSSELRFSRIYDRPAACFLLQRRVVFVVFASIVRILLVTIRCLSISYDILTAGRTDGRVSFIRKRNYSASTLATHRVFE